jgi:hypothetical protein
MMFVPLISSRIFVVGFGLYITFETKRTFEASEIAAAQATVIG